MTKNEEINWVPKYNSLNNHQISGKLASIILLYCIEYFIVYILINNYKLFNPKLNNIIFGDLHFWKLAPQKPIQALI